MSDLGLYASVYEQLRIFADRLDHALVLLRSGEPEVARQARHTIARLLREFTNKNSVNPATRLVALILKQELPVRAGQGLDLCERLAQILEHRSPNSGELQQLEQIAVTLDNECTSTLARIRGRA